MPLLQRILTLLSITLVTCTPALAVKDCSKTKTMAELKQCDPVQYESTIAILMDAQSAIDSSHKTLEESNQALKEHTQTLHNVNEELRKINEDLKNRPH